MPKLSAFSMSETLITLGLIGILILTMVSLNNTPAHRQKIADARIAQLDSAIHAWGKAISKSNETGLGAAQIIQDDDTLQKSLTNYLNNHGAEINNADFTANGNNYGNGFSEIKLENGVTINVKYVAESNQMLAEGGNTDKNPMDSVLAVITANYKNGIISKAAEYAVKVTGVEDLSEQFVSWDKYEVIPLYDEFGHQTGQNAYCKTSNCKGSECPKVNCTGVNCTEVNGCIITDTTGKYVYEKVISSVPCGGGQNGSKDILQVASASGTVYTRDAGICCDNPRVPNENKDACVCPPSSVMLIKAGWGRDESELLCQRQCNAGEYSANGICILCNESNYCPNDGMTSTFECQAGHYCPNYADNRTKSDYNPFVYINETNDKLEVGGLNKQLECAKGTFQTNKNKQSCDKCEKGHYCPNDGMDKQIPCPAGTYNAQEGATSADECIKCDIGTFNPNPGATSASACKDCPTGSWTIGEGATTCTTCSAGTYFNTSTKECTPCPAGTYQSTSGAIDKCTPCGAGHYCPDSGMTDFYVCPCGTYQNETTATTCEDVVAGKLAVTDGSEDFAPSAATGIIDCPQGFYCPGACSDKLQCKDDTFTALADGTFAANGGATQCARCPENMKLKDNACVKQKVYIIASYPIGRFEYCELTQEAINYPMGVNNQPSSKYKTGKVSNVTVEDNIKDFSLKPVTSGSLLAQEQSGNPDRTCRFTDSYGAKRYWGHSGSYVHNKVYSDDDAWMDLLSKLSDEDKNRTFNNGEAYFFLEDGTLLATGCGPQITPIRNQGSNRTTCNSLITNVKLGTNTITNDATCGTSEVSQNGTFKYNDEEYNIAYVIYRKETPIVLDIQGDGLKFTDIDNGVNFDLNSDGTPEATSWTQATTKFDDAFLVQGINDSLMNEYNQTGKLVINGRNLFGPSSESGYAELAAYDTNGDGVVDSNDSDFYTLKLWSDMNHNGIIDAGELLSLSDQNVTSLSTLYDVEQDQFGNVKTDEYGNTIGFVGSFKMLVEDIVNGLTTFIEQIRKMIDVLFVST